VGGRRQQRALPHHRKRPHSTRAPPTRVHAPPPHPTHPQLLLPLPVLPQVAQQRARKRGRPAHEHRAEVGAVMGHVAQPLAHQIAAAVEQEAPGLAGAVPALVAAVVVCLFVCLVGWFVGRAVCATAVLVLGETLNRQLLSQRQRDSALSTPSTRCALPARAL